jgi:mono/diheme cytochrome c family protein
VARLSFHWLLMAIPWAVAACWLNTNVVRADDPAQLEFFEKRVRPLLATHCQKCHGAEKQENNLRVDSLAALIKGGDFGPAVVPGEPEKSLLVGAINHGEIVQMPPKTKLKANQIEDLTAWVKMGAPWPEAKVDPVPTTASTERRPLFTEEQRSFWAFQVPMKHPLPDVKRVAWVQSPIDAFTLAGLEAKGLPPAPPADKRTLIRRATFDLLGLPPTVEEVDAYLADKSPEAFARVVERLLASPHYGQRWGRHWLDVARYADSNGMDENVAHANAWRYRDYVIDSLNHDKPYDQFLREQIAGDLLPDPADPALTAERLTATGFLVIGPKMLAEDDPQKMEMDIVDEQLDTVGRTFLGLTLGCARCHDHKFDPLPTADYYSLAAIFKSTKTMENFKVVAMWHERTIASAEQIAERNRLQGIAKARRGELDQRAKQAGDEFLAAERQKAEKYLAVATEFQRQKTLELKPQMNEPPGGAIVIEAEKYDRGNAKRDFEAYGPKIGVIYNAGELPNIAEYDFTIAETVGYQIELRYAAAESRPCELSLDGKLLKANAAGKVTGTWHPDTQAWSAECIVKLEAGKHTLKLKCAGPFPHFDKLALVPTKLPDGEQIVAPKAIEQLVAERELNLALLKQWVAFIEKRTEPLTPEMLTQLTADPKGPFSLPKDAEQYYPAATQGELKQLRETTTVAEKAVPTLPTAMGASEGKIANLRVHLRGNYLTLDREVPRQFLRVIAGENQKPIDGSRSGRLELANWMTSPQQPLTSRVMVNRVWHWHFGNGLVRSPDNFGRLGETPDNPALLDYLAVQFVEQGWSLKALHRTILLSNTYQMSTAYNAAAAAIDPENRLHWRTDRRRLEAEALRDGVMAISGELDATQGGCMLGVANHAYVRSTASEKYDPYQAPRRSIYLPVARSSVYELFQAFDFADPSFANGQRGSTTVAPQALALMNSRLVEDHSRHWAAKLLASTAEDAGRLQTMYVQAYSRPPSEPELTRGLEFVRRIEAKLSEQKQPDATLRAWQSLCRVVLASSEFVYVE